MPAKKEKKFLILFLELKYSFPFSLILIFKATNKQKSVAGLVN